MKRNPNGKFHSNMRVAQYIAGSNNFDLGTVFSAPLIYAPLKF